MGRQSSATWHGAAGKPALDAALHLRHGRPDHPEARRRAHHACRVWAIISTFQIPMQLQLKQQQSMQSTPSVVPGCAPVHLPAQKLVCSRAETRRQCCAILTKILQQGKLPK